MDQSGLSRQGIYVPRWVIILGSLIVVGCLGLVLLGYHERHTPHMERVSQKQINAVSTLAAKIGAPTSTLPEDDTMHLVIYYDGYSDPSVAQRYVGLIDATLKETQPYKSVTNLQTTVITSPVSQCHVQTGAKNVLKCNDTLRQQVNQLNFKHFKLLILSPLNFAPNAVVARGKNSVFYLPTYQGALTQKEIDTFVSLYALHELGHSFGLRDEYIRTRYDAQKDSEAEPAGETGSIAYSPAAPNCAPDKATAEKWWGAYVSAGIQGVGYYKGCAGNADDYYPVQGTVMSGDPTDATYGRVSEDYIRGVLDCFYGNHTNITYPAGDIFSGIIGDCKTFEAQYPNFWNQ